MELNSEQLLPARHLEGAVLVTAGAGSGKTRLLTQRIANLVESGVRPYNILCITFTNKAAAEMRERLQGLVDTRDMWIMTFHAMCVRLLRYYADSIPPYSKDFVIYAEQEKERVLKRLIDERELDADKVLKKTKSWISDCKNSAESFADYCAARDDDPMSRTIKDLMEAYRDELSRCNAMDFDDLLINCHRLLSGNPDVLERVQDKFRYISVDEFQDTNVIQYEIVRLLARKYGNIFIVGDEDQSIYGWRGANIENIFNFRKDFNAATYKLERNYRSSANILKAANAIISHNKSRLDKKLWTEEGDGARIEKYTARDEGDEAEYIVGCIDALVRGHGYKYSDFAVLMRLNALTRSIEERLLAYNINYAVFGGFKFFDRKEIKDILAYARLAVNPRDDEAVYRTINTPKRGIGDAAVAQLRNYCAVSGMTLNDCCRLIRGNEDLPKTLVSKVAPYGDLLNLLFDRATSLPVPDFIAAIVEESGYGAMLRADNSEESRNKLYNLDQLVASAAEFVALNPNATLASYIENVTLMSDLDGLDESRNAVTLATVHSAKGLEFKVVFIVGLDEGIFPMRKDGGEMEEERRLMYVAVTRARERLYMTRAYSRYLYGKRDLMAPSRFLGEDGSAPVVLESAFPQKTNVHALPTQSAAARDSTPKIDTSKYTAGTIVMHKVFGRGVIKSVTALKDMHVACVQFDTVGVKNLGLELVRMEIVEQ